MTTIAPHICRFEQVHHNIDGGDVPAFITRSLARIKELAADDGYTLDWRTLELRYDEWPEALGYRIQVNGTRP